MRSPAVSPGASPVITYSVSLIANGSPRPSPHGQTRARSKFVSSSFIDLGVPADLVAALDSRGITAPFEVQAATIPDIFAGRDVCGRAPTGSGKTLAFGIPLVAMVGKAKPRRPRALVLAPTRELAAQITRELSPLAAVRGRSVFAVYGGVGYEPQRRAMRRGVDVLVACPGRLHDLVEQGVVRLDSVSTVVIDEADRMADMGFLPQVRKLLDETSENAPDGAVLRDARRRGGGIDPRVPEQPDEARGRRDRARHHCGRPPLLEGRARRPQRARRRLDRRRGPHDRVLPHPARRRPCRASARQQRRARGRDPRWPQPEPARPGAARIHRRSSLRARRDRRRRAWHPRRRRRVCRALRPAGRLEGLRAPLRPHGSCRGVRHWSCRSSAATKPGKRGACNAMPASTSTSSSLRPRRANGARRSHRCRRRSPRTVPVGGRRATASAVRPSRATAAAARVAKRERNRARRAWLPSGGRACRCVRCARAVRRAQLRLPA